MDVLVIAGEIGGSLGLSPWIDPVDGISYLFVPYVFHALPHGPSPCDTVIHYDLFTIFDPSRYHFPSIHQVLCLMVLLQPRSIVVVEITLVAEPVEIENRAYDPRGKSPLDRPG